ncbi:class I adenylate-forming enzyme family protein [Thauera aminoaromatica]|uniref:Long-chain fatty acid--CoA ligase n=1 Tax=Thauera aminoaromatica TaxID=164330 RepID=A0A5C7S619_THASP|nr:class I adenylate-forming enzyme family protein [Thauera aminoaromatica]TXH78385.1 MAG: long-chain fatty acid--CoA ligase [Thauera aminoaromatica]
MTTSPSRRAPARCTLDQVVAHWARLQPERAALRWQGSAEPPLSWGQLQRRIVRTAQALRADVAACEAVAVVCASSNAFHVLVNALWRLGAGVVLVDRNWGPAIVLDLISLVGCRTLFADAAQAIPAIAGVRRRAIPDLTGDDVAVADDTAPVEPDVDRVAIYATTSGTTDNPKCVVITHRQIRAAYDACLSAHDFGAVASCACLFEVNSLGVLGVCFLLQREIGAGTTVFPSFSLANIGESWQAVMVGEFGFVYLVPPLVRLLNTLPPQRPEARHLLAFCSAAPVAEAELRRLESRYALRAFNSYGLTELTFAVFFGCRAEDGGASESIGRPVGIQARLVDDAGQLVPGAGTGELHIAGPMLTAGYLRNPRATSASWDAGWLRTGDIAERDEEGRYYLRGRKKDVVLRGGYTYYLHELEHYLRRAPAVVDACAFKGRDLPSGDELCVVVQAVEPIAAEVLLGWIREHLGATKLPNALYVWHCALPRNSNGKIQRNVLSQLHLQGRMHTEETT